jgi:FKBP-type peptidyl-prolyl cis-trans isomerase
MESPALLRAATLCAVLSATGLAQDPPIPECKDTKKTASGLEYCVLKPGKTDEAGPGPSDFVEVHYTGWLTTGKKFDSSRDRNQPTSFRLDQVIKGWTEGLQLMTPGARFKFTIPPELGYGEQDKGVIPPNSTLVFDVELLSIKRMPAFRPASAEGQKTTESGLKYEIVKKGKGDKVGENDGVVMRYALFGETGKLQACTEDRGQKLSGTRDTLPFPFLKELCDLVQQGDVVRAEVPPRLCGGEQGVGGLPPGSTSVWELEVLEVKHLPKFRPADAAAQKTTPSGLKYEVVKAGNGEAVGKDDSAVLRFALFTSEGKMKFCSELTGEKLTGKREQLPFPFLKELCDLMKVGDVVRVEVPPALAGNRPVAPGLDASATTVWELELVGIGRAPKLVPSDPEKLVRTDSGLQYEVIKQGTGKKPAVTDTVVANYTGWLQDGTSFDSSYLRSEPSEFQVNRVIRGWIEGLQLMQEGAVYQFVIPPDLGYGPSGQPPAIPANATLIFRVELVKVK